MEEEKIECPCKRVKCVRHGHCEECREHHMTVKKNSPYCDRLKEKADRKSKDRY
jgi:hypothetical protein